jgi:hypothetical protein
MIYVSMSIHRRTMQLVLCLAGSIIMGTIGVWQCVCFNTNNPDEYLVDAINVYEVECIISPSAIGRDE